MKRSLHLRLAAITIIGGILISLSAAGESPAQSIETAPKTTAAPSDQNSAPQIKTVEQQQAEIRRLTALIKNEPGKIEHYLERARIFDALQQFDAALADYARVIELAPNDPEAYSERGSLYASLNQFDRAILDYTRVIELTPDEALPYNSRAQFYLSLGESEKAAADLRKCDEILNKSEQNRIAELTAKIVQAPDDAENYRRRAKIYLGLEQPEKAFADFDRILQLDFGDDQTRSQRASNFVKLKQFDRALADYNVLIKRAPDNANLYRTRGEIYFETKQFQWAVADFSEVIRRLPGNRAEVVKSERGDWEIYQLRARAYEALGDSPKAVADRIRVGEIYWAKSESSIRDLTERIKSNPDSAELYRERGSLRARRQQHESAIVDLTRAIALAPDDSSNYAQRAMSYRSIGNREKAGADEQKSDELNFRRSTRKKMSIAELSAEIKNQPADTELLVRRANLYFAAQQFAAALNDYSRALKLSPLEFTVLNWRAESFVALKRYDDAISDYTRLLAIYDKMAVKNSLIFNLVKADYYAKRGDVYLQSNRFDQAIADFTRVAQSLPNYANGYRLRAPVLAKAKRYKEAINDYTELIALDPADAAAYQNRAAAREQTGEAAAAAADRQIAAALDKLRPQQ